jgi:xanthine dehydrogenase accessory factor
MQEILQDIDQWFADEDAKVALATVVGTWGSSPRRIGAKMAVHADGRMSGSVSGGCVEGAVVEACIDSLDTGQAQLLHYGVADETAWGVGLACGGSIDIFVEVLDETWYQFYRRSLAEGWTGNVVTIISGPENVMGQKAAFGREGVQPGSLGDELELELLSMLPSIHKSQRITLESGLEVFADRFQPPPTLVMIGGVHVAIALTRLAKGLGYQTVVIDPRRSFGSEIRFPEVDYLIQKWPQRAFQEFEPTANMAVALLTHDPKIDDQALKILLTSTVFYIGALGSRKTHAKRKDRLRQMGFGDEAVARIHAPIGLEIGAANPEEIALAIMAEIVGVRRGVTEASEQ